MKLWMRIWAAVLVLCLLLPWAPGVSAEEDWRTWSQRDSRWGSIRLGSSRQTVYDSGCLVTAVTKLILQSGLRSPDSFHVGTFVKWLNANNGFSGAGLKWGAPGKMVEGFEFVDASSSYSRTASGCREDVLDWIRKGYHIALAVKNNGHWVAVDNLKTLETGEVYIWDSIFPETNTNITLAEVYGKVSGYLIFSGYAEGAGPYLVQCDQYPAYGSVSVAVESGLMRRPVAEDAVLTVAAGTVLTVTGLYRNPLGEYWYQTATEDGVLYIRAEDVTWGESLFSDVTISGVKAPTQLTEGKSFSLRGQIESKYTTLTEISCFAYDGAGQAVIGKAVSEGAKSYSLYGSAVDRGTSFGKLPKGEYTVVISVVAAGYHVDDRGELAQTTRAVTLYSGAVTVVRPVYTVALDAAGGTVYPQTLEAEKGTVPQLPQPRREGYVFLGWFTEDGQDFSGVAVTGDVTLYARWECDHQWGPWELTLLPTYTQEGQQQRTCETCAEVETMSTPALVLPGDVDGSGVVDGADAILLRQYVALWKLQGFVQEAADINGDGFIDGADAMELRMMVAK